MAENSQSVDTQDDVAFTSSDNATCSGAGKDAHNTVASLTPEANSGRQSASEQAVTAVEEAVSAAGDRLSTAIDAATQAAAAAAADISKSNTQQADTPGAAEYAVKAFKNTMQAVSGDSSSMSKVPTDSEPAVQQPSSDTATEASEAAVPTARSAFKKRVKRSSSSGSMADVVLSASRNARQAVMASRDDATAPQRLRKAARPRRKSTTSSTNPTGAATTAPVSKWGAATAGGGSREPPTAAAERSGGEESANPWRRAVTGVRGEAAGSSTAAGATYVTQARELYFDADADALWKVVRLRPLHGPMVLAYPRRRCYNALSASMSRALRTYI